MRVNISRFILSAGFAILVSLPVLAQSSGPVRAHVPFDFFVNKQKFEAGDYIVRRPDSNRWVLSIQSRNGKKGAMVLTTTDSDNARPISSRGTMVFDRYGSAYMLSEIREAFSSEVTKLPKAKSIVQYAKAEKAPDETVLVAVH